MIPLPALVLSWKTMRWSSNRHRSGLHLSVSWFFIANSCMEWTVFHWSSKYITVLRKLAGKNMTKSLSLSLIIPQISTDLDDSARVNKYHHHSWHYCKAENQISYMNSNSKASASFSSLGQGYALLSLLS